MTILGEATPVVLQRPPPGALRPDSHKLGSRLASGLPSRITDALAKPLPTSTNIANKPPTDQGQSSACTWHALVKGIQIVSGFIGSMHVGYSMTGAKEGRLADNGRELVDCLAVARSHVHPFEGNSPDGRFSDLWTAVDTSDKPANVSLAATPEEMARAMGHPFDLGQASIDPKAANLSDLVVASLAAGCPIYLGTQVGQTFEDLGNGVVAQPDPANDPTGAGHALLIVGHRTNPDGSRDFLVENSWGESWDDAGECRASLAWVAACWELHPLVLSDTKPETLGEKIVDALHAVEAVVAKAVA